MSDPITIRLGTPEDADAITEIWRKMADEHTAYDPEHWQWAPDASTSWRAWYLQLIADPAMFCLVAVGAGGSIDGYLVGKVGEQPPVFLHRPRGDVFDIAVRAGCRGQGVGSALLRAAIAEFTRRGCRKMHLTVATPNAGAVEFYRKQGMREVTRGMCLNLTPEEHSE